MRWIGTGFPRLVFLAALGLFGFGLLQNAVTFVRVWQAGTWPVTEGVVLNRDSRMERVVSRTSSSDVFIPEIRYRYRVAGQSYVSERVYPDRPEEWRTREELRAFMDSEFRARSTVPVRYNPANPAHAVLILRGSYAVGLTLMACGLAVLVVWFAMRADARIEETEAASS